MTKKIAMAIASTIIINIIVYDYCLIDIGASYVVWCHDTNTQKKQTHNIRTKILEYMHSQPNKRKQANKLLQQYVKRNNAILMIMLRIHHINKTRTAI